MRKMSSLFIKITYPVLVLLVLALLLMLHYSFEDYDIKAYEVHAIKSALYIVRSIEAYNSEEGRFPEKLEELVPKYLPRIPKVYWGETGWIYEAKDEDFTLTVGYKSEYLGSLNPYFEYSSKNKAWDFTEITEL